MSQPSHNAYSYSVRTLQSIGRVGDTTLSLDSSPAYDLLASLRLLAAPSQKGRWQAWREETTIWLQSKQPDLFQEIRRWFAGPFSLGLASLALIPLCSQPGGIEEFLTALTQLSLADFLRLLVVNGPTDPETPLDAKTLLSLQESLVQTRVFADRYLRFTGRQRTLLLQVLQEPAIARSKLLETLQQYHEQVYAPLEGQIQEEREQAARRLQIELSAEESPLRTTITDKYELREFTPAIVVPSVFLERNFSSYFHEINCPLFDNSSYEPCILLIGTQRVLTPQRKSGRTPTPLGIISGTPEQWANLFSVLADPSRLRLLHLLAERPYYQQELAAALNLSGATISHHLTPLFRAGLIRLGRQAHRTYIMLQSEELQKQLQESQQFLLSQDKLLDKEGQE